MKGRSFRSWPLMWTDRARVVGSEVPSSSPVISISANGEHWLYLYPGGVQHIGNRAKIRTKEEIKIDLDIRADGGKSRDSSEHPPSGVIYQAEQPWTAELLSAMPVFDPAWIPTGPVQAARPTAVLVSDTDVLFERGKRLAMRWQTSERGQGHGTDTFKLAGYLMHTLGLSEPAALLLMSGCTTTRVALASTTLATWAFAGSAKPSLKDRAR